MLFFVVAGAVLVFVLLTGSALWLVFVLDVAGSLGAHRLCLLRFPAFWYPAKQEIKDLWHINRDRNGTAICASFRRSGAVTESLCVCCVVKT